MKRLVAAVMALTTVFAATPCIASGEPLSHVSVTAKLSCKQPVSAQPNVDLWLPDVIVTGREYYPKASTVLLPDGNLRFTFDVPGGVYELFARVHRDVDGADGDCSWNGGLTTLPGVTRDISIELKTGYVDIWDRGDFVAGSIAGDAAVAPVKISKNQVCGKPFNRPSDYYDFPPQSSYFYWQLPWLDSETQLPGLSVSYKGHVTVLALPAIVRTPLQHHAFIRRDVTLSDLQQWSALPSWSVVCDTGHTVAADATPGAEGPLQPVAVTAIIQCSDRNDLYASETPTIELEDQLHRGRFIHPAVRIDRHVGNVVDLSFDLPPGAYDLGMRLPRPPKAVLPCYSAARVAVLPGHARNLTFLICTCGGEGSNRGFIAGLLEPASVNVSISRIPISVSCGSQIPDLEKVMEDASNAVVDGGRYYGTYDPYDPSKKAIMIISGPGLGRRFVAIDNGRLMEQPTESLSVFDVTMARVIAWYGNLNWPNLICEQPTGNS